MEKDITDRLEMILKAYELTPSAFSDQIQIQRSAMSHIFSRRNRPSLDVIQKVLKHFPEINSNWLLSGIGKMKQLDLFEPEENSKNIAKQESITPSIMEMLKPVIEEPINNPHQSFNQEEFPKEEFKMPERQNIPIPLNLPNNYSAPFSEHESANQLNQPSIKQVTEQEGPLSSPNQKNPEPKQAPIPDSVSTTSPEKEKVKEKEIEKIIIFYKDKTFTSYSPE